MSKITDIDSKRLTDKSEMLAASAITEIYKASLRSMVADALIDIQSTVVKKDRRVKSLEDFADALEAAHGVAKAVIEMNKRGT